MTLFLSGLALLIAGYFLYGKYVESVLGPDDRPTPAVANADGVDFVVLPHWKNMLIQLLNIAGIGPVIGVILGIKFGAIVFLIIPIGNIIGGAVHDFLAGMMSLRKNGANLPMIMKDNLGWGYYAFMNVFVVILLLLVVAVFINVPANLIDNFKPEIELFWWAVGSIFFYYLAATLFPIDKIIGRFYPIFGFLLLVGTGAIFAVLLWEGFQDSTLLVESEAFKAGKLTDPIIPCLFITIACGIMSGFHGTQSPIVARTMKSERQARSTFYGMMIVEGLIAMVWAAGGLAIYNLMPQTLTKKPADVLGIITTHFLGRGCGSITIIAVIILAITSGDTALRSVRLTIAETFHIEQRTLYKRILLCLFPCVAIVALLYWSNSSAKSFGFLWNYFAWGNQVLAASTLLAGTVWLLRRRKNPWIAIVPGVFMMFVVLSYILWTSPQHGGPMGVGLPLNLAYGIAAGVSLLLFIWGAWRGKKLRE